MTDVTPKPTNPVKPTPAASSAGSSTSGTPPLPKPVRLPDPPGVDLSKVSIVVAAGTEGVETPSAQFPQEEGAQTVWGRLGGPDWPTDENGNPIAVPAFPFGQSEPKEGDK